MQTKVMKISLGDPKIVAPCGINCGLCRAYVRDRKACPGCRGGCSSKSKSCLACAIKNCKELAAAKYQFCFTCARFPCALLLRLDKRYRTKYGVSVLRNLERIKAVGVESFVTEEASKWSCPECGSTLCMHKPQCFNCGHTWKVHVAQ